MNKRCVSHFRSKQILHVCLSSPGLERRTGKLFIFTAVELSRAESPPRGRGQTGVPFVARLGFTLNLVVGVDTFRSRPTAWEHGDASLHTINTWVGGMGDDQNNVNNGMGNSAVWLLVLFLTPRSFAYLTNLDAY